MTNDEVKSVLAALDRAKDDPMDDSALMAVSDALSKFEIKHGNSEVSYYTQIAMRHPSLARKYKLRQKRTENLAIADDQKAKGVRDE